MSHAPIPLSLGRCWRAKALLLCYRGLSVLGAAHGACRPVATAGLSCGAFEHVPQARCPAPRSHCSCAPQNRGRETARARHPRETILSAARFGAFATIGGMRTCARNFIIAPPSLGLGAGVVNYAIARRAVSSTLNITAPGGSRGGASRRQSGSPPRGERTPGARVPHRA